MKHVQPLTKDARGFVEGVVTYLRRDGKSRASVPKVQALLHKVTKNAEKEKYAHVESSVPLSKTEKDELMRILSRLVGHRVELVARTNPALLCGLRIRVADWIVDTSWHHQLDIMRQRFTEPTKETI